MIRVEGLQRNFGDVVAVADVGFAAEDGRVTGLLGPNGAGKTTTLRVLYGLLRPDAGSAYIDDVDVLADAQSARRRVGVLPDARGLYQRLTPREHMRYAGQLHGLDDDELATRTKELTERLDMGAIIDRRTEGFSAGERMKVAIARALVHDPPNVILDEPTTGLDVMTTRAVREVVRDLRARGKCVLFSSHVMQEVSLLCDDIIIVAHGRVVARGAPDALCEQAGKDNLEDAFVHLIGTDEGLL
jgi:sodium transport system ATP-binding protein